MLALSRRLRGIPGVVGLELMNNPVPGDTPSPGVEAEALWPFYRRAIAALRADGERRPLWLDRSAASETADALRGGLPAALSSDRDLVLAPHDYTGVFSSPAWPAGGAWATLLAAKLEIQDAAALGSSFWMWKQRPGFYNWQLVQGDGGLRGDSARAQLLSRPYAEAAPGLLSSRFDGRSVGARLSPRRFRSATVALEGDVVSLPVPPGAHTLVLS